MEYLNAADVLPKKLLKELSTYVNGQLLYVPSTENKKSWGSKSGSRQYYEQRNSNIVELYQKLLQDLTAVSFVGSDSKS